LDSLRVGFALISALVLVACGGGGGREASDAEGRQYQAAVNIATKEPETAVRLLAAFLNQYPRSSLADDAAARLAELALQAADEQRAMSWLYLIVREYPNAENADRARVLLAGMEARADRPRDARRLLGKVRFGRLSPAERRLALRLFADLSDDPVDHLNWQVRERDAVIDELKNADYESPVLGGGLEDLEREIAASVDAMSDEDLERAARILRGRLPAGRIILRLSRRALQQGDFAKASLNFRRVASLKFMKEDQNLFDEVSLALQLRERIVDGNGVLPSFAEVAGMPQPDFKNATGVIGVVLPLTGRFAKYGEESLKGIMLAAQVFDPAPDPTAENFPSGGVRGVDEEANKQTRPPNEAPNPAAPMGRMPDSPTLSGDQLPEPLLGRLQADTLEQMARKDGLRLIIRDSQGTPEAAALAVQSLAAEEGLVAIIGPLLGDTAEAAAPIADALGIPLLALTSREEVPKNRSYVFRLRTSPRDEIRTLVDYASNELGAQRYAILYPKDSYGRGMRDHFWEAVLEQDAMVVASSGYDPTATDFAKPIRNMIGYTLLTKGERAALKRRSTLLQRARRLEPIDARLVRSTAYAILGPEGDPLPPQVDFDVLFIPDSHDKIVLIAPQLSFHETGNVHLMGPSGWNHPELLTIGRRHVRGAVISALFHEQSQFPFVAEFSRGFSETFAASPDVFAAHGYDAARLVMVQLKAGVQTREGVRNGILRTQAFPGASGIMNMAPDGNAQKRPFLLKVRGGRLISLD
jgi:ABC-type branched-subunit amino acid transport system substrate-binding protein